MIRNVSKVLDEKLNEILNNDSQDSSTCTLPPASLQDTLFSFNSPSSSLEFPKNPALDHALDGPVLQLCMNPAFIQENKKP